MFSKIFIERNLENHQKTQDILKRFPHAQTQLLECYSQVFGRVKKPYLHKRNDLQLFIAEKKGQLIKEAPDAYGLSGEPHYYFIHAYNCIYECEYCYLQGYFNSPDIVLFINHEDITQEIADITRQHSKRVWFHAGEFSDSLALSHISQELPTYFKLFSDLPQATLELRTKSVNIKELLKLSPLDNVITSFSLAPQKRTERTDLKTPSLKLRLKAMKELYEHSHPLAIHLDPIIHEDNFETTYQDFFSELSHHVPPKAIRYISIGVVRFTADVYRQVALNYPQSDLHAAEFITSFDNKVRYPKPFRLWMLRKIKDLALHAGFSPESIYECME